jgi:predicted dehydrogenase
MKRYRAAVIGLGRMGSTFDDEIQQGGSIFLPYCHAPSYHASPLTDLVAGADPHSEQRAIFGERWGLGGERLYADHREMLEREKPDMVSICTTARIRARIVLDAVAAGVKAIWAEKPIAISLTEADEMVRTCREHGVALAINCARRWHPGLGQARRLIEAGELGRLLQVTAYGQCGLSHNGSHLLDIVRYLAGGNVSWVYGEMESDEAAAGDADLMGNGYLAFDNGVRAYVRALPCGPASWELDVIGETGRIRSLNDTNELEYIRTVPGGPRGRGVAARLPFPLPNRMQGTGLTIIEDLVHAIESGQLPRCSGEDGRAALEIAVALRESHRRGGTKVTLPLADRSLAIRSAETLNDAEPARIRRLRAS